VPKINFDTVFFSSNVINTDLSPFDDTPIVLVNSSVGPS